MTSTPHFQLDHTTIAIPDQLLTELSILAEKEKITVTSYILGHLETIVKNNRKRVHINRTLEELLATEPTTHWIEKRVVIISTQEEKLLIDSGATLSDQESDKNRWAWKSYSYRDKTFVWIDEWFS